MINQFKNIIPIQCNNLLVKYVSPAWKWKEWLNPCAIFVDNIGNVYNWPTTMIYLTLDIFFFQRLSMYSSCINCSGISVTCAPCWWMQWVQWYCCYVCTIDECSNCNGISVTCVLLVNALDKESLSCQLVSNFWNEWHTVVFIQLTASLLGDMACHLNGL